MKRRSVILIAVAWMLVLVGVGVFFANRGKPASSGSSG